MSAPLVSTITACFRMQKYLRLFLEELPHQTMFDRLQIVLDHNDPEPEEIALVKEFQQRYPGRLKHIVRPVIPIAPSWNACIAEADADLVAIWSVDDLRPPNSIELQYNALLKHPESGVAYGDFTVVSSFGSKEGQLISCDGVPKEEFTRSMIWGPFFMFRKSLCVKAGLLDEQLKSGLDFDFAIRLALHTTAVYVKENLGYYLNEGMGASTRPDSLQPVERTAIELRYGIYDKLDFSYLHRALEYNIPFLLQNGRWVHISEFVPDWGKLLEQRSALWLEQGLNNHMKACQAEKQDFRLRCKGMLKACLGEAYYKKLRSLWRCLQAH